MSTTTHIEAPAEGARIVPGEPTPDNPIIPFIEGDGIGVDITPAMRLVVELLDVELGAQPVDAFADAIVVEADPRLHGVLELRPDSRVEVLLRTSARGAEEAVMLVEALDQDGRDLSRRVLGDGCGSLG